MMCLVSMIQAQRGTRVLNLNVLVELKYLSCAYTKLSIYRRSLLFSYFFNTKFEYVPVTSCLHACNCSIRKLKSILRKKRIQQQLEQHKTCQFLNETYW